MISTPIHVDRVSAGSITLTQILDTALTTMQAGSVLAITSKLVSLCENAIVPREGTDQDTLIRQQAQYYMPHARGKYGINFTITNDTLIPNAGIDESNVDNVYALWPADPQATANQIREYLVDRFGHADIGVVITDSTCRPLRWGVSGIALAHSGFDALHNYIGEQDLYGREFRVAQADVAGGLAAAAVLVMGEGSESTPLALLEDLPFVHFTDRNPTPKELADLRITMEDDLFAPFLTTVEWQHGEGRKT